MEAHRNEIVAVSSQALLVGRSCHVLICRNRQKMIPPRNNKLALRFYRHHQFYICHSIFSGKIVRQNELPAVKFSNWESALKAVCWGATPFPTKHCSNLIDRDMNIARYVSKTNTMTKGSAKLTRIRVSCRLYPLPLSKVGKYLCFHINGFRLVTLMIVDSTPKIVLKTRHGQKSAWRNNAQGFFLYVYIFCKISHLFRIAELLLNTW